MTVKQFTSVARGDANYAIAYNGNAYPFNPEDDFQMFAYGDFEISHVDLSALGGKDDANVYVELELKMEFMKEVQA